MAVITVEEVVAALRLGNTDEELAEATRLLAVGEAIVEERAPNAPDVIKNEGIIRIAAHLYDKPTSTANAGYGAILRNSGAGELLLPYRIIRATSTGEAVEIAQEAVGTAGNPVVGVGYTGHDLTFTFQDETTITFTVSSDGQSAVDQLARNAAVLAQTTASEAVTAAAAASTEAAAAEDRGDQAFTAAGLAHIQANNAATAAAANLAAILALTGRKVYVRTGVVNITTRISGAVVEDVVLEIVSGTLKIYRVRSITTSPYLSLAGTVSGGAGGVQRNELKSWVFTAVDNPTAGELGLNIQPWALGGGPDVPYARMNDTLEPWAVVIDAAARLAGSVPQIIPNERLPTARFLPGVTAAHDGKIAKVVSGAWALGDDLAGTGGGSNQLADSTRFRFVSGTGAQAGKVFLGFEFVDRYNTALAFPTRTILDVGVFGYIPADPTRTDYVISQAQALDVRALLGGQSDAEAIMDIVTNLPTAQNATWGLLYGQSSSSGQVNDVYYRRRESTINQLFLPTRLDSQTRNLHGFSAVGSTLLYGFERGGALSPEAEIIQLVEEKDVNGNITIRLVVTNGTPLTSDISVLLWYKGPGQNYTTSREVPLFHDATFPSGTTRRYASAVTTGEFRFVPGTAYTIKWRIAGSVHDLVLHADEAMRRLADEEDVEKAKADVRLELYEVEDRVKALEDVPAPETPETPAGGFAPTPGFEGNINIDNAGRWVRVGWGIPAGATWLIVEWSINNRRGPVSWVPVGVLLSLTPAQVGENAGANDSYALHEDPGGNVDAVVGHAGDARQLYVTTKNTASADPQPLKVWYI